MMKIAIPTQDNKVDGHLGHCMYFAIFKMEENLVTNQSILTSPQRSGCKSNIAYELQRIGVTIRLAENMGESAKNRLESCGIKIIRRYSPLIDRALSDHVKGGSSDLGLVCPSHEDTHICNH